MAKRTEFHAKKITNGIMKVRIIGSPAGICEMIGNALIDNCKKNPFYAIPVVAMCKSVLHFLEKDENEILKSDTAQEFIDALFELNILKDDEHD